MKRKKKHLAPRWYHFKRTFLGLKERSVNVPVFFTFFFLSLLFFSPLPLAVSLRMMPVTCLVAGMRGRATLMRFLCFRERNLSRHPLDLSRLSLPSFLLTLANATRNGLEEDLDENSCFLFVSFFFFFFLHLKNNDLRK